MSSATSVSSGSAVSSYTGPLVQSLVAFVSQSKKE